MAEEDKTEEVFVRPIAEHTPMPGMETAWLSRVVGDPQQYNPAPGSETPSAYCVNVIRSLRWPGAVTVSKGGKFTSVYVGYGIKRGDPSYNPTEPPDVQQDPIDQTEMPEPTPQNPPKEQVEPDTDKKDGEDENSDEQ